VDISTMAFYENQLTTTPVTPDVIIPGTLDRVRQLLNDDPNAETIGPFKAMDTNVRNTKTRAFAYLPFGMLEPLLGADLTDRQVFELIVPALINAGLEDTCAELINFLIVALVNPNDAMVEAYTLQDQVGRAGYVPGSEAISYCRDGLLHRDLHVLKAAIGPPMTSYPALLDMARGMHDILAKAKARAERSDCVDSHDEARHPNRMREKMREMIADRLFLLWWATSDEDLPSLYQEWAVCL
jgi:hypothetical protein